MVEKKTAFLILSLLTLGTLGAVYIYSLVEPREESTNELTPPPPQPPLVSPPIPESLSPSQDHQMSVAEKAIVQKVRAYFVAGDYGHSLSLVESSLKETGHSPILYSWLQNQLDPILIALGWLNLKTGLCEQAIELFKRAEAFRPSQEAATGLAYCHHVRNELDAAEEKILWLITNQKELDSNVWEIYSQVLESKGRYSEAANVLSKLRYRGDKQISQRVQALRNKARRAHRLQTINTRLFLITFEDGYRDVAEKTLSFLEKALDDLMDDFSFREPRRAIEVLLDPPDHFGTLNPTSPQWAEALYDGRIHVPVKSSPDLQHLKTVLIHELIHALFGQMTGFRPLPSWFEEGIAQFVSECQPQCKPFSFSHNAESFLSIAVLNTPFHQFGNIQAEEAYRQSLYLIMTLHEWRGRDGLRNVIENIKIDTSPDSNALLSPLDLSFRDLHYRAEQLWKRRYVIRL
ncbi:MAG: hypothetical protein HYW48_04420 [Deltaproteobacteria bacterium]|nr:hypothetical protein [Deltaproteobacteria bacterium]